VYRGGTDAFVTGGQAYSNHAPLDPNLSAEGGMCKVAVRSTFTTGTVTVTATSPGLGSGTASYTTVAPSSGQTSVFHPAVSAARADMPPVVKVEAAGSMIRYYVSRVAGLSLEVLDARGKVLRQIAFSRIEAGWHVMQMGAAAGSGVCFVRVAVNGIAGQVKPMVLMR
jgi:hypothetical protein